jgi:hypothetical protein
VTQGPLLSAGRVLEAIKLSLGVYDAWLADYVAFQDQKPVEATSLPPALTKPDDGAMRDCPTWWRRCLRRPRRAPRASDVQVGIFRAEPAGRDANGVRGRAEAEVVADDREAHGAPGRVAIVRAQPAHERAVAVVHA